MKNIPITMNDVKLVGKSALALLILPILLVWDKVSKKKE